ncbi:MAG: hypothetical protein IV108_01650 [Burkholderiales bacterium]|nr:hypothetical protein [Burkholderiales bacterium]
MMVKKLLLAWLIGASLCLLPFLAYGANRAIEPSPELLKLVGVSTYKISEDIRIKVSPDDVKSPRGISACDNSTYVNLFLSSKITGVTSIKVAIETESLKQQAKLFSIYNDGGLSRPYMSHRLLLNLNQHQRLGIVMNIWVFYFTDKNVYANLVQAQCADLY